MSNVHRNSMGPVMNATCEIQEISENPNIKYAAIDDLYRKHHEHKIHQFTEKNREKHISSWRVTKYAEEKVAYGTNYFLKIAIDENLFIHIRVHQRKNQNKYDFYALHEVVTRNQVTCIFTEDDPLTYFNY
ncbi:unnamed protein product [Rotaria socialis]|uniref:Cystatin domain-containing protein n=1 Tax=Rotaria socialis TaxID=392032 RepID=A0A817PPA6_9BILA|nr:unnamed protein product [Rotaria socialis]CAF3178668.1 unnamed protein product [Rotaria socialis]CAF3323820.1 unnamed protein product [Rotaria socialis]CAF3330971.1 unnamed protein product [Rotaria socialis]CAF3487173.1 unnamed protein product [Rotaria socialis]